MEMLATPFSSRWRAGLLGLLLLGAATTAQAQTPGVGIGTTAPHASAALDVSSTTKGLLPPRLTQTQRDAISPASTAAGLIIYNTTTGKLNTWNGTSWEAGLSANEQPYQGPAATFGYTGSPQTYTVPAGITLLAVEAAGAAGGGSGGRGARVQATLPVMPGETLTVYVGGAGTINAAGGYNGGGAGFAGAYNAAGSGGGASDVRRSATAPSTALADRVLVAAGGGGGLFGGAGGAGGAPNGGQGGAFFYPGGTGATQSAGGSSGGMLGQGGDSGEAAGAGAGGGGYYGGGAAPAYSGGGGGSSWVTTTGSIKVVMTAGYQAGDGSIVLTPVVYASPVLDGSNFVNVPGAYDNLGNHTATQNLNLGTNALVGTTAVNVGSPLNLGPNQLVGNGGTSGLAISSTGTVGVAGSMGIGTTAPHASAVLEVSSISKGLLPPRMTTIQRDAIASPAVGLVIYNTSTRKLNTWNGTSWEGGLSASEQPYQEVVTYSYTGGPQTYTVPTGVTRLAVDARGAGGSSTGSNVGGAGARVQATLSVTPGQVLTIQVGGAGVYTYYQSPGGYNGGGGSSYYGGAGGGATDVRSSGGTLADRLLVAGGGGGSAAYSGSSQAGAGGAPNGGNGSGYGGTGATQSAGGSYGGSLGQGGSDNSYGGSGGGGYYGGGGYGSGGGGGGSSWVTPTGSSAISMTAGANAGNGSLTITPSPVYAAPVLDGSNFINVPGDNLGNHTATQALNLGPNALVGNGGSTGLTIASTGAVATAGALTTAGAITAGGNVQLGANQLVGNGGSAGLTVSSAGSVGIGTGSPATTLDVRTADASAAITVGKTDNSAGALYFGNPSHGVKRNYSTGNDVGLYTTAANLYLSASGTSTSQFVLLNNGNVGIGTSTAPSQKLDVAGNVRVGTAGTVGKVLTNTTGNSNLLAAAYGASGNGGTTIFGGSGNFTVAVAGPGVYTITFPASSGLSNANFSGLPVNVSLFGNNPGFVTYTGGTGFITVMTFGTNGAPNAGYYFSFSAFVP